MLVKLLYRSSFLKTTALLFSLFFYSQQLLAQKQTGYTLLWEISGKGMSKPSYVFASANFKDSRVYNFSDSVYIALANSSSLALEIHPDTLVKSMVNFGWNSPKKPSSGSVSNIYQQISPNGYLYGLAKTYQKKIDGLDKNATANRKLEREEEEEDDEAYNEEELMAQEDALEALIDAYANGNLNTIWDEIQPYYQEDDIVDYAQRLSTEMIALMQKETVFASISLIYLPGEKGIIALLKKAGYQLRAVGGNFTALAKDHSIDYSKMQWYKFKDESNNYSVDFPGKPHEYKHDGRSKIQGFVDPITNTLFRSTALYTGPLNNMTFAQYQDTVLNNYLKETGYTLIKSSREDKFGTSVLITEYANPKENELIKSKAIHLNGTYYTFTMIYNAYFNDNKAFDLFFNSIQISTPTAVASSQWVDYKNEMAAFSIKLPVLPNESKQEVPNAVLPESPYLLNYYMATDKVNLMNYIVRYSDYPPGMYIIDKKSVFEGMIAEFKQKGKLVSEVKTVNKAGHEGMAVDMIVANTYLETMLFIKGNRVYMMLKQNMNGPTKGKKDQFFESFTFLPNLVNKGITFTMDQMELVMPEQPLQLNVKAEDDAEDEKGSSFLASQKSFTALNRYTGGTYAIEKSVISKYYRTKALDTLFNHFVRELSKEQKLLADRAVSVGKEKGREFMSYNALSNIHKKIKIWVNGSSLYMQTVMGTEQELNSELANAFFDVKIKTEASEALFDFTSSKAPLLVQDLASNDPNVRELASGALSFYGFEKAELPQLYKALQHKYTNDTASYGTRVRLLQVLKELNDQQTPTFLKQLYQENKGLDVIQSTILSTLPYVDEKSYDWYFKTLTSSPTYQLKNYWPLFSPLSDSIAYVAANMEETLKLLKVEAYRPMVLDLVSTLLNDENKPTYMSLLESKKELITAYALKDLATDVMKIKNNTYNLTVYDYLNILTKLKLSSLADHYTQQVLRIDSVDYLHTNAIAARIKLNLAVTPALLAAKLDSLSSRYLLMRAYDEIGKMDEVPLKYRKHEEVAKLLMHQYLADEYDVPNSINLLDTLKEGDLTYYVLEFSYTVEGAPQTYIGVTGAFNNKKETLDFKNYYSLSNFELKTKDWLKTAKALIQEMDQ